MSDLSISATEHGKLRVFALSDSLFREIENTGGLDPLAQALGLYTLGVHDVQVVQTDTVDGMGLSGLLANGYDITPPPQDSALLDAIEGTVALIRSTAFTGPVTLTLTGEAKFIATYSEGKAPAPKFTPLESDAAKGVLTGPTPEASPKRGFGARLALIAMAAFFAAFAWVFFYYIGF